MNGLRRRMAELRWDTLAMYLACRDRRVPWYAKAVAAVAVAYALSPIDLIPDFIPVLGLLDDLIIVPAGTAAARRMIAQELMAEFRADAERRFTAQGPKSAAGAAIVVALWLVGVGVAAVVTLNLLR
jgi:uncharacterized membrane protein YkvA (DUF1232 family)